MKPTDQQIEEAGVTLDDESFEYVKSRLLRTQFNPDADTTFNHMILALNEKGSRKQIGTIHRLLHHRSIYKLDKEQTPKEKP